MSFLAVRDLVMNYSQGDSVIHVLKGVSLQVEQGESVAICGESGSGKSTLLTLLGALEQPTSGEILFQGQNITRLDETARAHFRRKNLAIIFQQFHLMGALTAIENISLPLELQGQHDFELRAQKALEDVRLSHRARHFPHQLSGGECQRVAIARAFATRPSFLLADEPSGNLDQATGHQVMGLLFDRVKAEHMTMILVTHNTDLAQNCDRQLTLRDGSLH